MPRDYKRRGAKTPPAKRATSKPRESTSSGFGTFLAGLVLGLVGGAAAVQFYHMRAGAPLPHTEVASQQAPSTPAPDESNRPRFEFYKLLPEMEVVVPEAEERAVMTETPRRQPAPRPSEPATASPAERYLLQVGAFKKHEDADRLKAQLALLGVEAQILRVEREGQVWHRVRVGPFEDRAELRTVRERLSGEGIESVLLKMAG